MKILESIIWLSEQQKNIINDYLPVFIPIIKGEITTSIRMPFSDKYVWNYYLLNPEVEEDIYLYKHFDELTLSHIFLLEQDNTKIVEKAENLYKKLTENFETYPILFLHFLKSENKIDKNLLKTSWKIEKDIFFTWHQKFLPLFSWNKISLDYYKKFLEETESNEINKQ